MAILWILFHLIRLTMMIQTTSHPWRLSGQFSDSEAPSFLSSELYPVSTVPFLKETGSSPDLTPNDNMLNTFFLVVSEDFFQKVSIETKRYAVQKFEKSGHRDAYWFDTSPSGNQGVYWSAHPYWHQPASIISGKKYACKAAICSELLVLFFYQYYKTR